jgi:hypothetical protein
VCDQGCVSGAADHDYVAMKTFDPLQGTDNPRSLSLPALLFPFLVVFVLDLIVPAFQAAVLSSPLQLAWGGGGGGDHNLTWNWLLWLSLWTAAIINPPGPLLILIVSTHRP